MINLISNWFFQNDAEFLEQIGNQSKRQSAIEKLCKARSVLFLLIFISTILLIVATILNSNSSLISLVIITILSWSSIDERIKTIKLYDLMSTKGIAHREI